MIPQIRTIFLVIGLVFFTILFSLCKGSTSIGLIQLLFNNNAGFNDVLLKLRLDRTANAFITGGLLSLAGSLMQLLLLNPLADPYVLGLSSGAALFTLLFMLLGLTHYLLIGAWLGSLTTILLIFFLARKHQWESSILLLLGVMIACGFSAGISFILLISPNATLHSMLFWLTGDLNTITFPWLGLSILLIGIFICHLIAPGLNILSRGEMEAKTLGLQTKTYRILLYFLSSLLTGTAVMLAGCIGFLGLIIPHLTRLIFGNNHRITLPLSVLLGGSLLTLADTFSRTLFSPQQIPVGMTMAFIGVPIFICLLRK